MEPSSYIAKPIVCSRDAIASHVRWKITLLMCVRMREQLSARAAGAIANPDECAIRRWLLSAQNQSLRRTVEHRVALERHADFHRQMQRIAALLRDGEFAQAERLLNCPGEYQNASNGLATALMALEPLRVSSVVPPASSADFPTLPPRKISEAR